MTAVFDTADSRCVDRIVVSPNIEPRVGGRRPDLLLLHYTGMENAAKAIDWLSRPESKVSCHYVVAEDGAVTQMVPEALRAWHAGLSHWAGETDINSRSIGIELAHPGHEYGYRAFAGAQIAALIDLSHGILARNPIPPQRVLAHSDIAPERKEDPGELFPWDALHAAGIGHWVPAEPIVVGPVLEQGDRGEGVRDLQYRFRQYGYAIEEESEFGLGTKAVVVAFQRHFRPQRFDGIADVSTLATLDRLIATLPGGPAASA